MKLDPVYIARTSYYSFEAAVQQQTLNELELEVLQHLQEATLAGSEEAKHLLDVAKFDSLSAAAEIYYQDYRDLSRDNGGSCSKGLARPEDRELAAKYYQEFLDFEELRRRAAEQAKAFTDAREAAEAQMESLQEQQLEAAERLGELNESIATTDKEITEREAALAIAEARVAGLERIREQTEATFNQLLALEQLNLAQAQLEQEFAAARQEEIEAAVAQRLERDRLAVERQRLETQARIEQLRQVESEEDLRQALNQVRADVGLADVDGAVDTAALQVQLAGLLASLQTLGIGQTELPEDLKALLAETQGDLLLALQGDEAKKVEENLLEVADGLLAQVSQYQEAIAENELALQREEALLAQAEEDVQGATLALLQELDTSGTLGAERELLTPLNVEVLHKVAYAEQAIEISEQLAQQSRDLLNDILKQRKARNKAFWNETLGTILQVQQIVALILTIVGIGAALLAVIRAVSLALQATLAAINGDLAGALFNVAMAIVASYVASLQIEASDLAALGNNASVAQLEQLSSLNDSIAWWGDAQNVATGVFQGVRVGGTDGAMLAIQALAKAVIPGEVVNPGYIDASYGAYQAYRAHEEGDSNLAIVHAIQAIATAATAYSTQMEPDIDPKTGKQKIDPLTGKPAVKPTTFATREAETTLGLISKLSLNLANEATTIHRGVQAYEDDRPLDLLESVLQVGGTLYNNFSLEEIANVLTPDEEVSVEVYPISSVGLEKPQDPVSRNEQPDDEPDSEEESQSSVGGSDKLQEGSKDDDTNSPSQGDSSGNTLSNQKIEDIANAIDELPFLQWPAVLDSLDPEIQTRVENSLSSKYGSWNNLFNEKKASFK